MDTALRAQVESSAIGKRARENGTVWQVQVADSAMVRSAFGCGGCPFQLDFGFFGTQIGLGLRSIMGGPN
jgi:hypothetical protein